MGSLQWNCVKHCILQNVFRSETSKKRKVKIKTQWENSRNKYGYMVLYIEKTVTRVRKDQCNVSGCKNNLWYDFKAPKYAKNIFFVYFFAGFWKCYKNSVVVFLTLNICRKLEFQWSLPTSEMYLVSIFWVT